MELNSTFNPPYKENRKANLTVKKARKRLSENARFFILENVQSYCGTHTVCYSTETGLFCGGRAAEMQN